MFFKSKPNQIDPEIKKIFDEIGYNLNPKQLYMEKQKLNDSRINYNQILKEMILEINELIPKEIENKSAAGFTYTPYSNSNNCYFGYLSLLYKKELNNLTENKRTILINRLFKDIKAYYKLLECKVTIGNNFVVSQYIEIWFL